jgi:plastocyanin
MTYLQNSRQRACLHAAGLLALAGACVVGAPRASGATTTNVTVADNFFNPSSVTIKVNDSVKWNWSAGNFNIHSSTGPGAPPLWDTSPQSAGFTFTRQFTSAGSFAYHCTVHAGQTGTVTVQAANTAPLVSLTLPTNNATFAAPWTGTLRATNWDGDGTVSKVDFFSGTTKLGTVSSPAANASFTVTNLAAANYTLTAVATDNSSSTTTSAPVAIRVVTPVPIVLSSPQRLPPGSFQFNFSANTGLRYAVRRSLNLPAWVAISTNTATNSTMTFRDDTAGGAQAYYSIQLLPNP